jgi:hypothetical protein
MVALISKYGIAGYGMYWILNEHISKASEAKLDLSKMINKSLLCKDLMISIDQLDEFLSFLINPEIDLVNNDNGIITTDRTQEDFLRMSWKRQYDRDRKSQNDGDNGIADDGDNGIPAGVEDFPDSADEIPYGNDEIPDGNDGISVVKKAVSSNRSDQNRSDQIRKEKNRSDKKRGDKFIPPKIEEVEEYCRERNNNINPERFINFYESKGWLIGKNKMKSWKAAVRTWEMNSREKYPDAKPVGVKL